MALYCIIFPLLFFPNHRGHRGLFPKEHAKRGFAGLCTLGHGILLLLAASAARPPSALGQPMLSLPSVAMNSANAGAVS